MCFSLLSHQSYPLLMTGSIIPTGMVTFFLALTQSGDGDGRPQLPKWATESFGKCGHSYSALWDSSARGVIDFSCICSLESDSPSSQGIYKQQLGEAFFLQCSAPGRCGTSGLSANMWSYFLLYKVSPLACKNIDRILCRWMK